MARSGLFRLPLRGTTTPNYGDGWNRPNANGLGHACIAFGLPSESEVVRLGRSFVGNSTIGAAIGGPPPPTSTVTAFLWNGEADGGKSYIISSLCLWLQASANVAEVNALYGHNFAARHTGSPPGFLGNFGVNPLSGVGNFTTNNSKAIFGSSSSTGWPSEGNMHPIGTAMVCANTSNTTLSIQYEVYGRYIVPPQGVMGFNIAQAANSPHIAVTWHEVNLNLG